MAANTGPTFNIHTGVVVTNVGSQDVGFGVTLSTDGKILVGGAADDDFAVLRYNPDGTLDSTFSGDGVVTTDVSGRDLGLDIAFQPANGTILVAGASESGGGDFSIARYTSGGTLDMTFSGDGKVTTDFGGNDVPQRMALQADGKIILAGNTTGANESSIALARYNTDGNLDTTFDGDGKVVLHLSTGLDGANDVLVQADGKIVVAGFVDVDPGGTDVLDFAVLRYNVDGSLDTTFGGDGVVSTDFGGDDFAMRIALQADGKLVVGGLGGSVTEHAVLARYNTDGSLDSTFDVDGKADLSFPRAVNALAVQADGRIVVGGDSGGDVFAVARLNADGGYDTTFSGSGRVTTDVSPGNVRQDSTDVVLQPDGKIVQVGFVTLSGGRDIALVRYNSDGRLDASFGATTTSLDGAPVYTENGAPLILDSSVHVFDADLASQGNYAGASVTLVRHDIVNPQDIFSASGSLGALTQGGALTYSGVTVGMVTTNSLGTLVLTFNGNATQDRVDGVLSSIAYSNTGDAPPPTLQIDWRFSDGNTGGQGTGGALSALGSTTVTINQVNDAPVFLFNDARLRTDQPGGDDEFGSGVAMQADGKIVVVGSVQLPDDVAVWRYNIDGTPDLGFGVNGRARADYASSDDRGQSVVIQADGKIVVAAITQTGSGQGSPLLRFNVDGTLDTTFDADGKVGTTLTGQGSQMLALQSDGKLVVVGGSPVAGSSQFGVMRFNADGSVDTSFDGDGKVVTDISSAGPDTASSVLVQADGRILVGGSGVGLGAVLARYNANGSLDTAFDGDGKASTPLLDVIRGMALQADGKILLTGFKVGIQDFDVVRLNADGSLDTAFGTGGRVTTDFSGAVDQSTAIVVRADGRILVSGSTDNGFTMDFAVARYLSDGSLDTTFNITGKVVQGFLDTDDSSTDLALQADGRIVVTGTAQDRAGYRMELIRFNAVGGSADTTFAVAPTYITGGTPVVLDADVRIFDPELFAGANPAGATLRLQRHGAPDASDVFSATGPLGPLTEGAALTYFTSTFGTVTRNSGGTLLLTFNSTASSVPIERIAQALAYSNTGATTSDIQLDWTFSDGNTGAQGSGGEKSFTAVRTINIDGDLLWTHLPQGLVVTVFNPNEAHLRFDDAAISAADVSFTSGTAAASTIITYAGKTITLHTPLASLTATNVTFDDGSVLVVGDNTTGIANDNAVSTLSGGTGDDQLIGLGGADHLTGGAGADRLDGGPGYDAAHYDAAPAGLLVDLSTPSHNTGEAAGDTYVSIEALFGTAFNDTLIGNADDNGLSGLAGDDYLQGGSGNDSLGGGDGNDQLEGGAGADALAGGAGFDYAKYKFAGAAVTVDLDTPSLNTGEAAGDAFNQVEGVIGSRFDDQLYGNSLDNDLAGLDGNDMLFGRGGNDNLQGGNGDDTLDGGAGMDRLVGGAGNDTFVFHKGEANGDTIVDFDGKGALPGDQLVFQGYGLGATFTQIDATHWSVNSLSGPSEVISVTNGAAILPTDYSFI